ncbi:MAG: arylsulfatase [Planctomycetes bacterium]|nr:arylsulfatase [Planctomycetota bacterium]
MLPAAAPCAEAGSAERPNIIVILADDMGYSDIGCFGGEIQTPNLDRLAAEGLRFTSFCNTGRCCPTRASLLTGLYPHRAGVGHMTQDRGLPAYLGRLNDGCVTIAEVLKEAGYIAMMTGKWHVGGEPDHWPTRRGFEMFYGTPEGGGFYFKPRPGRSVRLGEEKAEIPEGWYITDALSDHAVRFIDEARDSGKPFFLYVAHIAPHWPLQARREDIARYRGKYLEGWEALRKKRHARQIELGIVEAKWGISPADPRAPRWEDVEDKEEMDLRMAVYAAQIDVMDRGIGRILSKVREIGAEENTLIMFLSDNGGCAEGGPLGFTRGAEGAATGSADSFASYGLAWANASNTPFRRFKHWTHEGGIATPLIARWPRGIARRGEIERQPGHVIDILATCVDAAGAKYPEIHEGRRIAPLDGRSLRPAFEGRKMEDRALYWEHEGNRAVLRGGWKLVAAHGGDWELYGLEDDRCELDDLAAVYRGHVEGMILDYDRWAERCGVRPWSEVRQARPAAAAAPAPGSAQRDAPASRPAEKASGAEASGKKVQRS